MPAKKSVTRSKGKKKTVEVAANLIKNNIKQERQATLVNDINVLLSSGFNHFSIQVQQMDGSYYHFALLPVSSTFAHERLEALMKLADKHNWKIHLTDRVGRGFGIEVFFE